MSLQKFWILPVCDTLMGKGVMDGHDPKYTGMIGMHGTKASNFGVSECDLLIALGARFSDRVVGNAAKFASGAKILHIDIDAAEIDKNIKTTASVVGDLKEILTKINEKLPKQQHTEWMAHIEELKEKYPLSYDPSELSCPYIMQEIDRITKVRPLLQQMSDSIRCGHPSIIPIPCREPSFPPVDLERWDMALAPVLEHSLDSRIRSALILQVMAASV